MTRNASRHELGNASKFSGTSLRCTPKPTLLQRASRRRPMAISARSGAIRQRGPARSLGDSGAIASLSLSPEGYVSGGGVVGHQLEAADNDEG
jgi:hypothetical protein